MMEIRNINKRSIITMATVLVVGMILGGLFFGGSSDKMGQQQQHKPEIARETIWTCSMHPQIRQNKPGQCPICAMDLIPLATEPASGDGLNPDEIQISEAAMQLGHIQTLVVKRGVAKKEIHLLGRVQGDERNIAQLTARFAGRIEQLYINFTGQEVKKGQKMASIYSPELITAQKELLEAVKFRTTNPAFYKASRSKLKLWNLSEAQIESIENSREPKNQFDIFAPISGTVSKRHIASGDYIKEGSALFELIDLSRVWVLFEVYESDLPWIRMGDLVNFSLQSLPGRIYSGPIRFIDPFIDAKTRVARIRIEVANPGQSLKPEMFANGVVESVMDQNSNELLVPKSSVLWTGKRAVVYVRQPNRQTPAFLYREIVLGPEAGNFYVVAEGIQEGEEIAVNGVFKIDASAQLAGKPSMMNPNREKKSPEHQHGDMVMPNTEMPVKVLDPVEQPTQAATPMTQMSHEMFKVFGSCTMCKDRIEKTVLALNGVAGAEWNVETKMLHISFNSDKIDLTAIQKAIAAVGHDTDKEKAPDDVYDQLPPCCLYRE